MARLFRRTIISYIDCDALYHIYLICYIYKARNTNKGYKVLNIPAMLLYSYQFDCPMWPLLAAADSVHSLDTAACHFVKYVLTKLCT